MMFRLKFGKTIAKECPFFYLVQQLAVADMAESLVALAIGDIVLPGVAVGRG